MMCWWWSLPGPSSFVDAVQEDLRNGKSITISLPTSAGLGLRDALHRRLSADGALVFRTLDLAEEPASSLPLDVLHSRFGLAETPGAVLSPQALAKARRFSATVLWLEGMTDQNWPVWRQFLLRYEAAARASAEHDPARIVVPLLGSLAHEAPPAAIALQCARWEGIVSRLDMQMYVTQMLREKTDYTMLRRLFVAVTAELAGSDPDLAECLCRRPTACVLAPLHVLRDLARDRRWPETPPDDPRVHWEIGAMDWIDGAPFVHSAAAAMWGQDEEIRRRIWRAQVAVLFPYVEEVRVRIVASWGEYLRVPMHTNFGPITDKRDLEIGQICHQLRRTKAPRSVQDASEVLARTRHALAHLETVSIEHLEELTRRVNALVGDQISAPPC